MNFVDAVREVCPKTTILIQVIGALILLKKIYGLITKLYKLLRKRKNLLSRYGPNSWALITGSSQGIGRAMALQLAKQGFNVIISARTLSKLQDVEKAIKEKYPRTEVKILVADYKKSIDWSYITELFAQIQELDISIVVNNVGVDVFEKYAQLEPTTIKDLVSLNCYSVAFSNRYFLPLLEKRTKQSGKKCAIVNISSIAGTMPMPYYNIYSASKAYVDRLSLSLKYQHPNLDILTIRPSEVSTPMTCNKQLDIFTIKAEQCASGILDQLGYEKLSYGHWRHQLQGWLYEMVPEKVFMFIFEKIFVDEEMSRRKKYQKKA